MDESEVREQERHDREMERKRAERAEVEGLRAEVERLKELVHKYNVASYQKQKRLEQAETEVERLKHALSVEEQGHKIEAGKKNQLEAALAAANERAEKLAEDVANMGAAQKPCEHDWLQASGGGIVFCTKCHSTRAAQEPKSLPLGHPYESVRPGAIAPEKWVCAKCGQPEAAHKPT